MHIKYAPFVNVDATLGTPVGDPLTGVVKLPALVSGKQALLTMTFKEAAKLQKDLEHIGVVSLADALG